MWRAVSLIENLNADGLWVLGGPWSEVKEQPRTKSGAGDMSAKGHPIPTAALERSSAWHALHGQYVSLQKYRRSTKAALQEPVDFMLRGWQAPAPDPYQ